MLKEVWKSISGYEQLYEISNLGRVKSLPRLIKARNPFISKEYIRKPVLYNNGYLCIRLSKDGFVKNHSLHRLIATEFLNKLDESYEVNHIDGNKLNNSLDNLEWVTKADNQKHAHKLGLNKSNFKPMFEELNGNSKLSKTEIIIIKDKLSKGISQRRIADEHNVTQATIADINRNKTHK